MNAPTNELILSEIIKINNEVSKINSEIVKINDGLVKTNDRIDIVIGDINELKQGQKEIVETINFIGNKVFDNHERRISSLENNLKAV